MADYRRGRAHGPRARSGDRGVALIEFALVLPILALLVFGTIDLGRAYALKNELKNAAREGAAYAQVYPTREMPNAGVCANPDNIQYQAQKELGADGANFTIEMDGAPLTGCEVGARPAAGTEVTVSASEDFDLITPFIGAFVGDPIHITEEVTVAVLG